MREEALKLSHFFCSRLYIDMHSKNKSIEILPKGLFGADYNNFIKSKGLYRVLHVHQELRNIKIETGAKKIALSLI